MFSHRGSCWALIERRAAATPDRLFATDERGRELSFAGLRDAALAVAAGLADLGVGPGSTVSWQLPTWLETLTLSAALCRLGAVQNPMIPFLRSREVGFIVDQLQTDLLVVPESWRGFDHAGMAEELAADRPGLRTFVVRDRQLPAADPARIAASPPEDPTRPAWVLYSSGTTAQAKGAKHSDASLLASATAMAQRMHMTPDDRNAIAFPCAHIGGLAWMLSDLLVGCASVLVETFDDDGIDVMSRTGVTLAGSGTPFNLAYLRYKEAHPDRAVLPAVRAFPGGGATRPPDLHARMKAAFNGAGILSGYGMTEAGFLTMADVNDPDSALAETEGRAYDVVDLRILRADGSEAAAGEVGEICVRGPMVMSGYVDPALDAAFDADGYFHTGDLGTLDAAGYLRVTGRLKDMLIRKGENISCPEIEALLDSHPAVAECAVIGLPDPDVGERCCAVVVPADPGHPPDLTAICSHLRAAGLATFKLPERLEITAALPKNASGKVAKYLLRERFGDAHQGIETPPLGRNV